MFFKLRYYEKNGISYKIKKDCVINNDGYYSDYVTTAIREKLRCTAADAECESVSFKLGFPKSVKSKIKAKTEWSDSDEAYAISVGKNTVVYAVGERGFIYAVATLMQLCECGELFGGLIYDYPYSTTRGYRAFLPPRAEFDVFRRVVDFLAYYKFNTIVLEIGGAMEYKTRPKINERWVEFCKEVKVYSGRTHEIQHKTYPWPKNSIHCDNGGGDILTHDECRELAAYCRSRGLEVIPECPTFSHCDYIVMAYPEIRERAGDMYPDTYCPNHPETYNIVFDVLGEVIDVFEPKMINIGHDEMYNIAKCPKCKNTPAPVLYANDVKKIKAFLDERGIKTMMWGEKLLNAHRNGQRFGGAGHDKGYKHVPALYPCRKLLPKDITMLHWYACSFDEKYDNVYHDNGFKVLFGNFGVLNLKNWAKRSLRGIGGGFTSNWGSYKDEYMQRNLQYLDLVSSAYAYWCDPVEYDLHGKEHHLFAAMRELYTKKCAEVKNPIFVTHTTDAKIKYGCFYDGVFIEDEKYLLGKYEIRYADGKVSYLPVKYGTNISSKSFENYMNSGNLREVACTTLPEKYGEGFVYRAVYENPNPDGKIVSISYLPDENKANLTVELIGFSVERKTESFTVDDDNFENESFAIDGGRTIANTKKVNKN